MMDHGAGVGEPKDKTLHNDTIKHWKIVAPHNSGRDIEVTSTRKVSKQWPV